MRLLAETGHPHARASARSTAAPTTSAASVTAFEMLAHGDLSLLVKAGVHWGLFGGAVANLGTPRTTRSTCRRSSTARLPGCFAMTETGHGSDVHVARAPRPPTTRRPASSSSTHRTPARARTTSATPRATGGWPSSSPSWSRSGTAHGVHAVLVPIRDEDGTPLHRRHDRRLRPQGRPRRRRQRPAHLRPRAGAAREPARPVRQRRRGRHLLSARSRTTPAASSPCSAPWSAAGSAWPAPPGTATRIALSIAIRYALERRQFAGPGTQTEVVLLDYRAHQRRLLPALATSYALQLRPERPGVAHARRADRRWPSRTARSTSATSASWSRSPRASRWSPPGTRPGRSRSAARRAAAPATSPRTGCRS